MDAKTTEKLLKDVREGRVPVREALARLSEPPVEPLGFAHLDHHRLLRTGVPEVVYGEGKTVEQIVQISERIMARHTPLLVTRLSEEKGSAVAARLPEALHDPVSRTVRRAGAKRAKGGGRGLVLVITAGTSDIPVAEEAAVTLDLMGERVERLFDVGVAGVHRLFNRIELVRKARAIIVAAGMEGALASIVAGVSPGPVVALPTSIGYGASLHGLTALFGMLNSCAPGVSVVNIDNGFGAAVVAGLINRRGVS